MKPGKKIDLSFYRRADFLQISRELLGKYIFTQDKEGRVSGGIIVETEGYGGVSDKASHAYGNRRTSRTAVMYQQGGVAYVYLCYGMYHLLNVVTNEIDEPHAVLIRGIEPVYGIEHMLERRRLPKPERRLTGGPGLLTQALGITLEHNGLDLQGTQLWIEDRKNVYPENEIIASPRVGVAYAGADALLPWRFRVKNNPWTSPAK